MKNCDFPASVTAVAYAIAEKLDEDEITLLITLLTQLRDTLTSLIICKKLDKNKSNSFNSIKNIFNCS